MSNMSYCRFQNTAKDLSDCQDALEEMVNDPDAATLSDDELRAAKELVETCFDIVRLVAEYGNVDMEKLVDRVDPAALLQQAIVKLNSDLKEFKS
jgi:hypothetical protein